MNRSAQGCAARHLRLNRLDRSCGGFTYIGVLLAVAFIGVGLAATGTVWQQTRQREKERELLFVGNQFRQALEGYYENPPPGKAKKFPQKIEDLLQDDRRPDIRRYLRMIYRDPMTGSTEWGLLRGADQGIVGLYSLSDGEPIKTANFDPEDVGLVGKHHYYEWRFIAKTGVIAEVGGAASNTMGTDALVPPPDQSGTPQSLPAADPELPPQQDPPPGTKNSATCTATFMNARAGCLSMPRKSGLSPTIVCLQKANAQYAQCFQ